MDNKIFLVAIFILIFLISAGFLFFMGAAPKRGESRPVTGRVCFKEYCFDVQLAQNAIDKTKGLMFQKSLEQNRGMLFLFDKEAKYSFWMQNTLIPLDIIWINENKRVVFISESNQPCTWSSCPSITPTADAKYVLELNSGVVQKIGLKLGNELSLIY
ncbi:MAG: hypothetical protein A2904_00605 [Candidatus Staskawiczbacteria bacterium RIFCSPLOWO2_01_FULL_33_9]|uniref:DUF192 domain-containing protein n=1 Tax=Candidatus Staskawiczbacteria bacterium RIFCSPLOWO2_01_FULL_33_9 TaxID=1802211 RepID=A0A1G2I8J2_9BACT|nr:MAG: hypothetical protein A2904_00605 [Candidatus Staskawiczbacteria bacterium RIFCSPLOWO2_01_FULL_33_9]